jgi:phospholipase C
MANGSGLAAIEHIVVLMLENRSFDHMLGFLYPGNVSPSGQPFDGLAGTESNLGSNGQPVTVFRIEPTTPNAYYMPGADPGEGYMATNDQLYGSDNGPAAATTTCRRPGARCRPTPTRGSSGSASTASASGCRPCWCRR